MKFQENLIEASAALAARAGALANTALNTVRARTGVTAGRVEVLKGSLGTLTLAGRELNRVARRHASRFVKENSALARAAGQELGTLARSTIVSLARPTPAAKARKPRAKAVRRRASAKTA
jgi:hypothetical protein